MITNKIIAKEAEIDTLSLSSGLTLSATSAVTINTLTVSSALTLSASSAITVSALTVSSGITFSLSTNTTSITFVSNISALSAASSTITFDKQTAYLEYGVIRNLSTVTTTTVIAS